MNKKLALSIVIAAFLLVGCAASGPKLLDSAEDIVGTWQSTISSWEIHFDEDGTYGGLNGSGKVFFAEFQFEGSRLFLTDRPTTDCSFLGSQTGIYEVELLENGNLKFIVIEDGCLIRVNNQAGRLFVVEWKPVP